MEQDILQLGNAGIQLALLVFGLVVFAVLAQVTEAASLFDLIGNLIGTGGLAVIQLAFQLVIPLLAHFEFFNHARTILSYPLSPPVPAGKAHDCS